MQRRIVAVVASLGLLAAACTAGTSSTQSITDADQLTRIDLPADWEHYSNAAMAGITETPFVVQTEGIEMPVVSRFAFDGAPIPTTANLLGPVTRRRPRRRPSRRPAGSCLPRS